MHFADLVKAVLAISASSTTAAAVLAHVTSRKGNLRTDTVRRLRGICEAGTPKQSVVNVLRQLETAGFGKFITGRRGAEPRFEWRQVEV